MAKEKERILVCEFHQETNTFNPLPTTMEGFLAGRYAEGEDAYNMCKTCPVEYHGIADAIEAAGGEVVPALSLVAPAGGRVDDEVFELFCRRIQEILAECGPIDAVCAALHGATCTISIDDACGVFLTQLRGLVGPDTPITASLDLHANVTEAMLRSADVLCGYQTYPHVDAYETGRRAGELCMRLLRKGPTAAAAVAVPMIVPPSGYTTLSRPFKDVIDCGRDMVERRLLLDFSVFNVQPWLDISEICSRVVAVAETPEAARQAAEKMAEKMFTCREDCWPELMTIDQVIDFAEDSRSKKPVILADPADSPNGGAVGDSVAVAMRLLQRGSKLSCGMFVKDPAAVKLAFEVGVGGRARFSLGAGYTPGMPGPLTGEGLVCSLHDGMMRCEGPEGKGDLRCIGRTAVIRMGRIDMVVCERPTVSGDPQILRHFGVEPILYDLVVVKANTSFLVPYSKFAGDICYADTPGACAANLRRLEWKHIPQTLYPFDQSGTAHLDQARVYTKAFC